MKWCSVRPSVHSVCPSVCPSMGQQQHPAGQENGEMPINCCSFSGQCHVVSVRTS